jgi:hypothetical protein
LLTVPLPPPIRPVGTFFFSALKTSETPGNAGLWSQASEPPAPLGTPISGRFVPLSGHFLRHNLTAAILVKLCEVRKFNTLHRAEPARVSNFFRSGGTNLGQKLRFGFGGRAPPATKSAGPLRAWHACPLIEAKPAQVIGASATATTAGVDPEPPIGCQFCCDAQQTSSPNVIAFSSPGSLGRMG